MNLFASPSNAFLLPPLLAGLVAMASIPAILPWLRRIALAKVTGRSSHKVPTPQGGGLGVLAGILAAMGALWVMGLPALGFPGAAALAGMAALGFIDDIEALPASRRLIAQALFLLIVFLPFAQVPPGLIALMNVFAEPLPRFIAVTVGFVGLLWIVNLTNFMDGLDGIIVASYAPGLLASGFVLASVNGEPFGYVALAAGGALLGFGVWNWNPAKVFLGDAGSLLIGLVTAIAFWLLLLNHQWPAAIIMWLYPFADATLTLARRLLRGEAVWQAHRQHAYQRAVDRGLPVKAVSSAAGAYALGASALAVALQGSGPWAGAGAVLGSALGCAALMLFFHRLRRAA